MNVYALTALLFISMFVLLATGLPFAFTLAGIAIIFSFFLWGPNSLAIIPFSIINQMRTLVLVAIPLFIFMANMLQHSGIADELYGMMYRWFGPVRGGLAVGTVVICTIMAAMTGISGTATVSMGMIALPSMLKRGYNKQLAIGSVAAGGALGILIPPSVIMILYALFAEVSLGALFAGGIVPGLILSSLFILYILLRCLLQKGLGPPLSKEERGNWKEKINSLKAVILPIILVVAVLGSIFTGMATPTEAAAVGAMGSIICAAILRKLTLNSLKEACYSTLKLSCMIMWIIVGASAFTSVYAGLGGIELARSILVDMPVGAWGILIGIQLSYFVLGCFLDPTAILMLTVPIYVPTIKMLGFDPIWFGVLFVINVEMAYLTPPFGGNLFYLRAIAPPGVTIGDIYRATVPFIGLQMLGLIIAMLFPEVILWLPSMLLGK